MRNSFNFKHQSITIQDRILKPYFCFARRNMLCIFKLIYGVGLRALRSLFMDINPSWSNQPLDAACFDKGTMKLQKEQEVLFKKGDINEWDFSLMATVLLYSKSCSVEISKTPDFVLTLRELQRCRNSLLGHPSTERMSESDFNTFWPLLSNNFIKLGADPTEVAEILLQSGICNNKKETLYLICVITSWRNLDNSFEMVCDFERYLNMHWYSSVPAQFVSLEELRT